MYSEHGCYKRSYILISLTVAPFLTNFVVTALNIALPSMALDLYIDAVPLGWIPTSYLIALTIFLIPSGKLGDIYGRKRLFNLGLILFTIGSVITVFSWNYPCIILARIFQGAGSAMIFSNLYAMIASIYIHQDRIRALSIIFGSIFLGSFLGPIIGGLLSSFYNWRVIFVFCSLIGMVGILLLSRLDVEWFGLRGEKLDFCGSLIFGISTLMIIQGLSKINQELNCIFLVFGFLGLIIFIIYENRVENPLFNLELLHNREFILNNAGTLIQYAPIAPMVFILSIYLQNIRGFSPISVGLILVLQPLAMLIVSIFSEKLNKMIEAPTMVTIAMMISLISVLIFLSLKLSTSILVIILGLTLSGIGASLFSPPNSHLVMNSVKKKYYGVASASITTMRGFGGSLGMSIVLVVLTLVPGNIEISHLQSESFIFSLNLIFKILCIVYMTGIVFMVLNWRHFKNKNRI
ncbi:MAG: MFS transporter [Methanobacterium sp.]|nr:MFS transporter [Methanobacterium sp.]